MRDHSGADDRRAARVLGIGSAGGNLVALTALLLIALIACPVVIGGMTWMMMREGH